MSKRNPVPSRIRSAQPASPHQDETVPQPVQIPDKLYFRTAEVAALAGVTVATIKHWATWFPMIRPRRPGNGKFAWRRKHIELVLLVKALLYRDRMTVEGAFRILSGESTLAELTARITRRAAA